MFHSFATLFNFSLIFMKQLAYRTQNNRKQCHIGNYIYKKKKIVIPTPIVMKVCMFSRKITKQYYIMRIMPLKAEPHIHLFLENNLKCWARIGEQVMCGLVYLYILGIHHYVPNRFSAITNFQKRRILANTVCESQSSQLLVNLCENAQECYGYSVFVYSRPFLENRRMCGSTLTYNMLLQLK